MVLIILSIYLIIGGSLVFIISLAFPKKSWRLSTRVIGLIIIVWIPFWYQIGGKQIFEYRCETYGGLKIYNTIEVDGYFNSRYRPDRPGGSRKLYNNRFFLQSLKELIEGRILFFESRFPHKTSYHRFMLKDKTDTEAVCDWYSTTSKLKSALVSLGLPSEKCLSIINFSDRESDLLSKYEVGTTSHHHNTSPAHTFVKDRETGEILAEYRSYISRNPWSYTGGNKTCPSPINDSEIVSISEKVFMIHM